MGVESKFIPPVVDTLVNVFHTMMQITPEVGEANIKHDSAARGAVTGLMTMQSDQVQGSLSLSFTEPVLFDMAKRMLHTEINEVDEIARDLAGEMTNIVVGGAKCVLEAQGYNFDMTLPQIFAGEHTIEHQFDGETILIPISLEAGDLFLELNFTDHSVTQ
ncbi:MAG: chemotaxis protein CheX [Gammaproteobacteria bacterium]|nr:chemotaxis protein CheX [Gammaproteobacteria bacterium]MDH5651052.1 chemotaxis protein CheX [Gammaproteobacteria bacterium]